MPGSWFEILPVDSLPALLEEQPDAALSYFVRRDLLEEDVPPVDTLWSLPEAARLAARQQPLGSWRYPGGSSGLPSGSNYDLLETFRSLRLLVDMYGFDHRHPAIQEAAAYLFSCQTPEGDIRGILGNQYMPYYHGAILALLVRAGYAEDARLCKGLDWLLSVRQLDGGWIVPAQAVPARQKTPQFWRGPSLPPERELPSSHLATDMALRPFAAHPAYRSRLEVQSAARLLKGRLLQPDKYNDRRGAAYWLKFQYPFWWHNLVATLDSLSLLGFGREDEAIARGLRWFPEHQSPDGLWETGYGKGRRAGEMRAWVGLAACRVLKCFYTME